MNKKHLSFYGILFLLLGLGINNNCFGQKTKLVESLKNLEILIGDYDVITYARNNEGEMASGPKSQATIGTLHDGAFIHEIANYKSPAGELNMVTFIGYDTRISKFKLCAMDKQFQSMDIYYGAMKGDELVFTNLESDKPFVFNEGQEVYFRLTYSFNQSGFEHLVEGTSDKGKTWFEFNKSVYKRRGS